MPTPTPLPLNVMRHAEGEVHVLGVSAQWPDRSSALALDAGAKVPAPVGLMRLDAPGTVIVMWSVDGNPLTSEIREVKRAGVERFQLDLPLPTAGYHAVTFDVLYPASSTPGMPTPTPPIVYSVAGATAPPTPLATPLR